MDVLCVVVMIIRGLQSGCAGGLRVVGPLWPSGGWGQCMLHCCDVLESRGAVVAQWWLGSVYAAVL